MTMLGDGSNEFANKNQTLCNIAEEKDNIRIICLVQMLVIFPFPRWQPNNVFTVMEISVELKLNNTTGKVQSFLKDSWSPLGKEYDGL